MKGKGKEELILKLLESGEKFTKTKISHSINANIYRTADLLKKMRKENKIKRHIIDRGVVWGKI